MTAITHTGHITAELIAARARDRILSVYAKRVAATVPYLPGGQILPENRPGIYTRVARICGVTVEAPHA